MSSSLATAPYSPLDARGLSLGGKVLTVAGGICVLTASSYIQVPMQPVPLTMQTLAVTVIGALFGWRLGVVAVLGWLGAALMGAPVLADDHVGGVARFIGTTGGYLAAFPVAAALCGWLAERGWNGKNVWLAGASMLIGNGLCLVVGALWLSTFVGADKAIALGVAPFVIGAALKSALGAVVMKALWLARRRNGTVD